MIQYNTSEGIIITLAEVNSTATNTTSPITPYVVIAGTGLAEACLAAPGQKLTFNNGNYIELVELSSTDWNLNFKKEDGTLLLNSLMSKTDIPSGYDISVCPFNPYDMETCSYLIRVFGGGTTGYVWNSKRLSQWEIDTSALQTFFDGATERVIFPGDESEEGGGDGTFDDSSDAIDIPSLPVLSAVTAGFITLYVPTIAQLNELADYMWSSSFDIDTFKKLFADPMEAIIGCSILPVSVSTSGSQEVSIGFVGTGVYMNLVSSQYVQVDCGTLTPEEYWGSALDYSPYTKFSIHLPYIGTRELNTDDIMGKSINVVYNIDILSGACTAMIKCGNSVLYEFSGACATAIPVTGQNWTQLITSCIQLAGAGIAVAATGGSAAGLLPSSANAVMAMKPNIQRTGAVSGSAGMLGVQQPYLIWELPRQSLAGNYNTFVGYPSNITALLSTLTGYTQIESVHLENISATQTELAEIETLLKEGVII